MPLEMIFGCYEFPFSDGQSVCSMLNCSCCEDFGLPGSLERAATWNFPLTVAKLPNKLTNYSVDFLLSGSSDPGIFRNTFCRVL